MPIKKDNLLVYCSIALFIVAIALVIAYQALYIIHIHPAQPFFEPDNYIYILFVHQALLHPNTTPLTITNQYLINGPRGFFEHAGLYLLPLYLYKFFYYIPLIWIFRSIQLIVTFTIYIVSLLFLKKILYYLPLNKYYHYIAYTLLVSSYLLMQYTQITEWRGGEFISAFCLIAIYILAYAFTNDKLYKYLLAFAALLVLAVASYYMWSGYFVFIFLILITFILMLIYKFIISKHEWLWKYILLILVVFLLLLFFLYGEIESLITSALLTIGYTHINCSTNVLHIGEMECLNLTNGLFVILLYSLFSIFFAILILLRTTLFSLSIKKYQYYLFALFVAIWILIPLSLIYMRMLSIIAPYLVILFSLGIITMLSYFARGGSSGTIIGLTIIIILCGAFGGAYIYSSTSLIVYNINNPINLTYISHSIIINSSVFTYFGYGDYLEFQDLKVYADTIQGLNYNVHHN